MITKRLTAALEGIEGLFSDWMRAKAIAARSFGLAYKQLRETRKKRGAGGSHTRKQWKALLRFYDYTCLRCGAQPPAVKLTKDHVIPLAKGGTNFIENIQPLCEACGNWKSDAAIDFRQTPIALEAARRADGNTQEEETQ